MKSFAISVPCSSCNRLIFNDITKIVLLVQNPFRSWYTKKVQATIPKMAPCTLPNISQTFSYMISRQDLNHRIN
jgi:hypothetical protein